MWGGVDVWEGCGVGGYMSVCVVYNLCDDIFKFQHYREVSRKGSSSNALW